MKRIALLLLLALATPAFVAAPALAATPAEVPAGKGIHYVYLVRHGLYDRDDKVDDRVGNGLNALGREQAGYIGDRLAGLPGTYHSLVSSTLLRAMQTADLMSGPLRMSVVRDSLLSECMMSSNRADYMAMAKPGEVAECDAQVAAAWDKYFRPTPEGDTRDVLVCHGNVIRYFVARAVNLDTKEWGRFDIGNCSLTVVQVLPDGYTRLATYSDVGHIPVGRMTFSGKGGGWGNAK